MQIVYEYNQPDDLEPGQLILPLNYVHFGDTPPAPGSQAQMFPRPWKPSPVPAAGLTEAATPVQLSGQPSAASGQRQPAASQRPPTASKRPPTASQPQPTASQPLPTASQPLPTASQPPPTVSQPLPTASQPLPTAKQQPSSQVQPQKDSFPPLQAQPQASARRAQDGKGQQVAHAKGLGPLAQTDRDVQPQQQRQQKPSQATTSHCKSAMGKRDTSWRPDNLDGADQLAIGLR